MTAAGDIASCKKKEQDGRVSIWFRIGIQYDKIHFEISLVRITITEPILVGHFVAVKVGCRLDPVAHWKSSRETFDAVKGKYIILPSFCEGDKESVTEILNAEAVRWA